MKESNFIFKNEYYPFNLNLFLEHSSHFLRDKDEKTKSFNILSEYDFRFDFSEESIKEFIQFSQNQEINITNNNAFPLNFLSKKYNIELLINRTEKYIYDHYIEIIDKFLSSRIEEIRTQSNLSQYEDLISKFIYDFITDDRLLSFQISSIYRIISQYHLQRTNGPSDQERNKKTDRKIIEFLFKYFEKHGIESSILFSLIEINDQDIEYVSFMFGKCCKNFDFRFINSSFYQIINVIIKQQKMKEEKYLNSIEELKEMIKNQQILFQNQISLIYSNLDQIALPKNITTISKNQFRNFALNEINIPSTVTIIESNSFSGCSFLKKITIPSSVKYIGSFAFSDCCSLIQIVIPSLVTKIEDGTFYNCSSLSEIFAHSSLTTIGNDVFYGCSSLKTINIFLSKENYNKCFVWNLNNFELKGKMAFDLISQRLDLLIKLLNEKILSEKNLLFDNELYSIVFHQILNIVSTMSKNSVIELFKQIESNNNLIDFVDSIFPYILFKESNLSKISYLLPLSKKLIKNGIRFQLEFDSNKIEFNKSSKYYFHFVIIMNEKDNLNLSENSSIYYDNNRKFLKFQENDDLLFYSIITDILYNSKQSITNVIQSIYTKSREKILNNEINNPSTDYIVSLNDLLNKKKTSIIDLIWLIIYSSSEEFIFELSKVIHPIDSELLLASFAMSKFIDKSMVDNIIEWNKWASEFKNNTPILFKSILRQNNLSLLNNDKMIGCINKEIQYLQQFPKSIQDFWNSNDLIERLEKELKSIQIFELFNKMKNELNNKDVPQKYQNMKNEIMDQLNHITDFTDEKLSFIQAIINDFINNTKSEDKNIDLINWPEIAEISEETNYSKTENIKLFESLFKYSQINTILNEIFSGRDVFKNIIKLNNFRRMDYSRKEFLKCLFKINNFNQFELSLKDKNYAIFTLNSFEILDLFNINKKFITNPQLICDVINSYANRLNNKENEIMWIYNFLKKESSDFCLSIPKFEPNDLIFLLSSKNAQIYQNNPFNIKINESSYQIQILKMLHQKYNSFGDSAKCIGQIIYCEITSQNDIIPQEYDKLKEEFDNLNNLSKNNSDIKAKMQEIFEIADSLDLWKNNKLIFNDISFLSNNWIDDTKLLNSFPSFFYWICKNQQFINQLRDRYKNYTPEKDKIPLWLISLRIMSSQNCIKFETESKSDLSKVINEKISYIIKKYLNESESKNYNWINILFSKLPPQIFNSDIKIFHDFMHNLTMDDQEILYPILNQIKNDILEDTLTEITQILFANKTNELISNSLTNEESVNYFLSFPSKYIQNKMKKKISEISISFLTDEKTINLKKYLISLNPLQTKIQNLKKAIEFDQDKLLKQITNSIESIINNYNEIMDYLHLAIHNSEFNEKICQLIEYQQILEPYHNLFTDINTRILSIKYNSAKELKIRLINDKFVRLPKTNADQIFYFLPNEVYNSTENSKIMDRIVYVKWLYFRHIKKDINIHDYVFHSLNNESHAHIPYMVFGNDLKESEFILKLEKLNDDLRSINNKYFLEYSSILDNDFYSSIQMINESILLIISNLCAKYSDGFLASNTSAVLNNELEKYLVELSKFVNPVFALSMKKYYPLFQELKKCGPIFKIFKYNYDVVIPKNNNESLLIPNFSTIVDFQQIKIPFIYISSENKVVCSSNKFIYKMGPIFTSKISKPISVKIDSFIDESVSCELEKISDPKYEKLITIKESLA